MLVSDFDFYLPDRLIAQEPAKQRDSSRLLIVDRRDASFVDSTFSNLGSYLQAGDVLVLNDTRVFPARLVGHKVPSGKSAARGRVEIFLIREVEPLVWEALVRPGRGLNKGARVEFGARLAAEIIELLEGGRRVVRFDAFDDFDGIIDKIGRTPLPPYIKRTEDLRLDQERYQTVYATERGAIAAPTAGLHFTAPLMDSIAAAGVEIIRVTLHVGYGTFQPVRVSLVEEHIVEPEIYTVTEPAAQCLNRALDEHRRIIAVGTTTTRALESAARPPHLHSEITAAESLSRVQEMTGNDPVNSAKSARTVAGAINGLNPPPRVCAGTSSTGLFIYPGFQFRIVSGLITNFHLPRSSLLMLVSAFARRDLILQAYRHAIELEYRFYSYGDAMLIL
jgi:S-adenosylmethionine:tRNA ribosyltransferase-isomerase